MAAGAVSYRVQASTVSDFSMTVANDSTVTTVSYTMPTTLNNYIVYYWHVNAKNSGGTSLWSPVRSFTTQTASPSAPVLLSPADSASGVSITPALTWNTLSNAVSYRVQVSTTSDFSTTIVDDSTLISGNKIIHITGAFSP